MIDAVIKKLPVVFILGLVVGGGIGVSFGKNFFSWVDAASFEKRYESLALEINAEKTKRLAAESKLDKDQEDLVKAKSEQVALREQISGMVTRDAYDKIVSERDQAVSSFNELNKTYDGRRRFFERLKEGITQPCTSDFLIYQTALYSRERDDGDVHVEADGISGFWVRAGPPQIVTIKDMYVQVRIQHDKQGCHVVFGVPPV